MKKVLYENKCKLNFKHVDDVLKMDRKELFGRRILAIQENNYFVCGKIIETQDDNIIFYNYTDHKLSSLEYLLKSQNLDEVDINLFPEYDEFKRTLENKTSKYEAIKILNYGFKYVLFLDEYEIVIDADDKPFNDGILNLLTFDADISYYSKGQIIAIQKEENLKNYEIQTLVHYPKSNLSDTQFIEMASYEFLDSIKYLNYFFNFQLLVEGEKLEL